MTTSTLLRFLVYSAVTSTTVTSYDWRCNLYCYNGGSCRHGHGKFGSYNGITDGIADELPFEQVKQVNGMFCTCPVGYTGLQCEIKYVVCGDDNLSRTCFNGSTCKKERAGLTGETYYRCECDTAESVMDAEYAGEFCEHIATVFCNKDGEHGTSYCTNGGKCKDPYTDGKKHLGCICPDGWEGDHCEKAVKGVSALTAIMNQTKDKLSVGAIVGIVIGSIVAVALLVVAKKKYVDRSGRMANNASTRRGGGRGGRQQEMGTRRAESNREIV